MSRICDGFNFSFNFPSPGLLMRGRPTSLGLAWTRARTESSVRILTLDTNKYYLLPLTLITTITPQGAPGAGHWLAETVSGVTTHLSLTDMPLTSVTRGDVTVKCDNTRGVGTTDGRSIGEWWVRSEEPGLGSEASGTRGPGLLCQWSRLAGARQWPGAGGGEEWTLDSLRRCGECGHWLLSVSLCSMPGWGRGVVTVSLSRSHLSSPCSVQCQCQEPRVSGDPPGVRVSGVTVSFPDIRVCLGNWSKVGWCGIGDMLSLCFMSDRHASITDSESPALPVTYTNTWE